jgi:hypothetical protein
MPDAYTFDLATGRYVDPAGRPVAPAAVRATAEALQSRTLDEVAVLSQRLTAGDLAPAAWERQMATTLRDAHLTAAALAVGGWRQLPAYQDELTDRLTGEFTYLAGFRAALPELSDAQVAARGTLYAQGVWATYQQMRGALADQSGMDEERNVTDPAAESCGECDALERDDWVDLGTLPEVGTRECLANCRCEIEYRSTAGQGVEELALTGAVVRYSEDQPRVPAGQPGGGEWAGGSSPDGGTAPITGADPAETARLTAYLTNNGKDKRADRIKEDVVQTLEEAAAAAGFPTSAVAELMTGWGSGAGTGEAARLQSAGAAEFGVPTTALQGPQPAAEPAAQALLRTMYAATQADLAAKGITSITLYRGMLLKDVDLPPGIAAGASDAHANADFLMRPVSSWTIEPTYAQGFAHRGTAGESTAVVIQARVPASHILSTARTGLGSFNEREFVVLGSRSPVHVHTLDTSDGSLHLDKTLVSRHVIVEDPVNADWLLTLAATGTKAYNPDQPRDDHGRWTDDGGSAPADATAWFEDQASSVRAEDALQRRVADALGARIEALPGYDAERFAAWLTPPSALALTALRGWQVAADSAQAGLLQSAVAEQFHLPAASRDQLFPGQQALSPTQAYQYGLLAQAIHAETQAYLSARGVEAVNLYRGESWHPDQHPPAASASRNVTLAPLSSWTTTAADAGTYALRRTEPGRQPVVLSAAVPASRVFSTPMTGIGGYLDREIVVLGGSLPVQVQPVIPGHPVAPRAFNPDQPRDDHGRWTDGGGGGGGGASAAAATTPLWTPDPIPGREAAPRDDPAYAAHARALEQRIAGASPKEAAARAEAYLADHARQAHQMHLSVDLTGLPAAHAVPVAAEIARWMDAYPTVASSLESVTFLGARNFLAATDRGNGNSWASTQKGDILLNGKQLGPKSFAPNERHELEVTSGWAAAGLDGVRGIVAHELGHVTENHLLLHELIGLLPDGVKADHAALGQVTPSHTLSHYARSSPREAFAEAFAQRELAPRSQWDPYTHRLDALLTGHGGIGSWPSLNQLGRNVARAFNPDEPRLPAGGPGGGEWTAGGGGGAALGAQPPGASLSEVVHHTEALIAHQPIEHLYAFDDQGRVVYYEAGDKHSVGQTGAGNYEPRFQHATLLHNHPTVDNPGGSGLSEADVYTAIRHDVKAMIAVTTTHRYIAERPAAGWPDLAAFKQAVLSARGREEKKREVRYQALMQQPGADQTAAGTQRAWHESYRGFSAAVLDNGAMRRFKIPNRVEPR